MLDASVHAIFATTPQGIVTHFNRSAETMLGYLAADMIGQPSVLRMFAPASLAERAAEHHLPEGQHGAVGFAGLVAMALDTTVRPFDDVRHWQALRHDGLEFPAQVLAVALHDADTAAVSGFLFVIIDLTDDLRSRAELQRAKQEAERANNAKTRFLAAASHDLRQPLAALSLYLGLLRSRLASADAPLMHSVDDCVSSLTELLDDLLDVSKLEAGVVSTELSDFSVDELLQRQVSVHSASAEQKGLRLRLHRTGFMAHTDQVLLARMVGNLIANAIRYTEQGGILLGCRRHLGRWWVEVRDTGIGIPQDQIGLIFEEFRQLGHGARNHGSGLGLAIVAKTAALLGLQVRVRSTPGRGSLFAIELPVGRVMERALLALPEPRTSGALCVALVDDNPQILRALGLLLQSAGHQVVAAARQDELMAKLGSQAPDLVITDYRLAAGSTGFEVVDQLRQRFDAALPALLITGDTDPALIRSMSQRGITIQYKPLKPDELLQFVNQVAQRRTA
jgi:signal transduction histidine kinase/CheY-like chemotaxis protein